MLLATLKMLGYLGAGMALARLVIVGIGVYIGDPDWSQLLWALSHAAVTALALALNASVQTVEMLRIQLQLSMNQNSRMMGLKEGSLVIAIEPVTEADGQVQH